MGNVSGGWYCRPEARQWRTEPLTDDVGAFHREMAGYAATPLAEMPELARELNVGRVFVKDESQRFGMRAFKILGASYAISRVLSARYGEGSRAAPLDRLARHAASDPGLTLSAATDGNHGRAVARVAGLLGVHAEIFVPSSITSAAKQAIASEGAEVIELDLPYDDVVAQAAERARSGGPGHIIVQDTSWDGYEEIPRWIVDGYSTLFHEVDLQLAEAGVRAADLVTAPSGVGALAQAAVRHYRCGAQAPVVLTVEPDHAPALLTSLLAGQPTSVQTQPTIMNGLNCGTPSPTAWPDIAAGVDAAVTVSDEAAAEAVTDLSALGVDAGPCGAASLAGVRAAFGDPARRESLNLSSDAALVLLSTESLAANPIPA